jgi:hypothetical protein
MKLYAITLFAMKPDPEHTVERTTQGSIRTQHPTRDESGEYNTSYTVQADFGMFESKDAAIEWGVNEACRLWPEAEGWTLHNAGAAEIDSALILEAATAIIAEMQPKEVEDLPM